MRCLYSPLGKKEYLTALKDRLESPFQIFDERVTGIVIGPCFAVAHYAPWEWNRKITSECNRAYGFVRDADGELEICFIRSKGLLSPFWLVFFTVFSQLICWIVMDQNGMELGSVTWLISFVVAAVVCVITAVEAALTEQGEAGVREVNKFLTNPKEYY